MRSVVTGLALVALLLGLVATPGPALAAGKPLVFAYYYIWFSPTSWSSKLDQPMLGPYDSQDPKVIAQHVAWAKAAGIDGFLVSWKHEPRFDAPLAALVKEADRQGLKLMLLYESLDFNRNPIDPAKVSGDLVWFMANYGRDPAFNFYGKPAVIWSGSWKFPDNRVAAVRQAIGAPDRSLLLGSERDAASYQARAGLFDGDAYYWSSADPLSTPGYRRRLTDLAAAVRADGGRWIAPVAPGFDARAVGGKSVIDRRGGDTYRASWGAAAATSPDAIGIISWNEFSENSHIEPSHTNGYFYLELTAKLIAPNGGPLVLPIPTAGATPLPVPSPAGSLPAGLGADSSSPDAGMGGPHAALSALAGLGLLFLLGVIAIIVRRRPAARSG